MRTINAKDTGSLNVGISAGDKVWKVGDKVQFSGEATPRTVTYVMGGVETRNELGQYAGRQGEKVHLCFKGQGPVPLGEVDYSVAE